MKNLNETLKYKNVELVRRIQSKLKVDHKAALSIFKDLLRWLWLSNKLKNKNKPVTLVMPEFLLPLDLGWHEFLLHTKDYSDFCAKYFGRFIHHIPESTINTSSSLKEEDLGEFLTIIGENIGYETLERWIQIYPALAEKINTGR